MIGPQQTDVRPYEVGLNNLRRDIAIDTKNLMKEGARRIERPNGNPYWEAVNVYADALSELAELNGWVCHCLSNPVDNAVEKGRASYDGIRARRKGLFPAAPKE